MAQVHIPACRKRRPIGCRRFVAKLITVPSVKDDALLVVGLICNMGKFETICNMGKFEAICNMDKFKLSLLICIMQLVE